MRFDSVFRSTSALGVLAGALVALLFASPSIAGMEREVDDSLQAVRAGTVAPANDLAERLVTADAGDWRAWYLRALAQRDRPLDRRELERLADVTPQLAELLRGLLDYMAASPDARLELARALVETQPDSALAHTLLGSSFLPAGRIEEALAEARRALELEPDLFLAARVALTALVAQDDATALREESCALVARFPFDSVVLDQALVSCVPDPVWETRWRDWSPVLHAQHGRTGAALALQRLVRDPSPRTWPAHAQRAVVAELDPHDRSWWAIGAPLIGRLGGKLDRSDRAVVVSFLAKIQDAVIAASQPGGDSLLATASLVLSGLHEQEGDVLSARTALQTAIGRLAPLQQPPLLRRLAALECASGLSAASASHAVDAFVLTHPFEPVPREVLASCGAPISPPDAGRLATKLLQPLPPDTLRSFRNPATPRLLAFWSVDCSSSSMEAKRLVAMLGDPSGPFAKHGLELVWVNVDPVEDRDRALAWARDAGIEPASVSFSAHGAPLSNALRVAGTPELFLITREGLVAWEMRGYRIASWAPEVERILRAGRDEALAAQRSSREEQ